MCSRNDTYVTGEGIYFWSDLQKILLSKIVGDDIVGKAVNQLYNNAKVSKAVDKKMFAATYEPLRQAVNEGFGKITTKVEFGTPNYEFLKQLQNNAASFAAFKNHANLKEMVDALKDEQGNRRTKEEFIREALKVGEKYNVRHLATEYDTAVRQARSAAQWQKALATKHLFPNIKYLPSVAANPREDHTPYYGITLPIEDPFWDEHLPQIDWGCQCGWEVTDEDTTDIPDHLPEPNPEFGFNPGRTGQVFDLKESSYIQSVPRSEQPFLIKMAEKYVNETMAAESPYMNVYESKSGTSIKAHPLALDNSDYKNNLSLVRSLANSKLFTANEIRILPNLNEAGAEQLRRKLLPFLKDNGKYPDFLVKEGKTEKIFEAKSIYGASKNTIKHAYDECREQCNNIILDITKDSPLSKEDVLKAIKQKYKFKEMKDFGDTWVRIEGEWHFIKK